MNGHDVYLPANVTNHSAWPSRIAGQSRRTATLGLLLLLLLVALFLPATGVAQISVVIGNGANGPGVGPYDFFQPWGLATDSLANVFVTARNSDNVFKLTPS